MPNSAPQRRFIRVYDLRPGMQIVERLGGRIKVQVVELHACTRRKVHVNNLHCYDEDAIVEVIV